MGISKQWLRAHRQPIEQVLPEVGYDYSYWARSAMYDQCFAMLRDIDPHFLDVPEISAGASGRSSDSAPTAEANYPEVDISRDVL